MITIMIIIIIIIIIIIVIIVIVENSYVRPYILFKGFNNSR
jgi:hypothetical protein